VRAVNGFNDLYQIAMDATSDRVAFRNVLQVLLSLSETEWIVRRLPLERRDLSGLRFEDMDLNGLSFRGANLEASAFHNCTLTSAVFAEAVMRSTEFAGCDSLDKADFGDLSTFFSATVDAGRFEEPGDFLRGIGMPTGPAGPRFIRPCEAANQVRFLFSKYVRPDGIARRNWLDEKGALAGRRYVDPKMVLDAARRHGYLEWEPVRRRYIRSPGDEYSDMIALVSKLQITPRLRMLLSDVCTKPGCNHVLEVENE
jgi:Pentapeptide repeats (9 copies)